MTTRSFQKIIAFALAILMYSCGSGGDGNTVCACSPAPELYSYQMPETRNDGWDVAHLSDVSLPVTPFENIVNEIRLGRYVNINSVVVAKGGKLVFEEYFNGFSVSTRHQLQSASKSIGSILAGLAIEHGYISDLAQPIEQYFPNYTRVDWSGEKSQITIEHLLTMSAGFDCYEGTHEAASCDGGELNTADNWALYTLQAELAFTPGSQFRYFTGIPIILHQIIARETDMPIDEFGEQFLFSPLGINNYTWSHSPAGEALALDMPPRAMAKIGQLFLNEGQWQGQQVLSAEWIRKSIAPRFQIENNFHYGYLWYQKIFLVNNQEYLGYMALGDGEQKIIFLPELDAVVTFTTSNYSFKSGSVFHQTDEIFEQYILSALTSN
ncbi:serine hydrolase [Thalassotalea sp. M1531]|uniref:Serine hydrolase n=1 Tax=Thalassotalea algicola TaxID=2716224 RepID=A0A7Y0L9M8_9GAMM|nr:serine hydrolase [Thalassotalea algicola]NMP30401.1 serine hydrolase [Thalassotalea algicola]